MLDKSLQDGNLMNLIWTTIVSVDTLGALISLTNGGVIFMYFFYKKHKNNIFCFSVKPHNPMVDSGSIIINSLIQTLVKPEISLAEKFEYLNDYIKVATKYLKSSGISLALLQLLVLSLSPTSYNGTKRVRSNYLIYTF